MIKVAGSLWSWAVDESQISGRENLEKVSVLTVVDLLERLTFGTSHMVLCTSYIRSCLCSRTISSAAARSPRLTSQKLGQRWLFWKKGLSHLFKSKDWRLDVLIWTRLSLFVIFQRDRYLISNLCETFQLETMSFFFVYFGRKKPQKMTRKF